MGMEMKYHRIIGLSVSGMPVSDLNRDIIEEIPGSNQTPKVAINSSNHLRKFKTTKKIDREIEDFFKVVEKINRRK